MNEYRRQQITELYGNESLEKVEEYIKDHNVTDLVVYADENVFEIVCGVFTNQSLTIDQVLDLNDIDMDDWADNQGWDGWDYDALQFVNVK